MADDKSYDLLSVTLNGLFEQAIDILAEIGVEDDRLTIHLPSGKEMEDMDPQSLASLVAETSNIYSKAARLSGIAKAELKIAQAAYKDSYKTNKSGKNEDERDKNAITASREQARRLSVAEAVSSIADGVESAARVASESSRKILDKIESLQMAEYRERHGQQRTHSEPDRMNF